jgi:hypothetical protein
MPRARSGFPDLPVEVRLQIYQLCIQLPLGEIPIHAWYKGGGQRRLDGDDHLKKKKRVFKYFSPEQRKQNDGFYIFASHSFPAALLRVNSNTYAEAREELYRGIHFRVEGRLPQFHIPILEYWLAEHPMRFSRHMSFTVDFAVNPLRQLKKEFSYLSHRDTLASHNTCLSKADMQHLASRLRGMPNLEEVTLTLCLDCCGGFDSRAKLLENICLQDVLYINRLKAFQEALLLEGGTERSKEIGLRLVVSCSEWWLGYSKPEAKEKIVERLRGEGFEAELAKDARCTVSRLSWGV